MSERAKDLSQRIEKFRDDAITFVEGLSDEDWSANCEWEEWTAGMTARHVGAGHFRIFEMCGMILEGRELPQMTFEEINAMSDKESRKHTDTTKAESLEAMRSNGAELVSFVAGLSDEDLDSIGSMPAFGGEASVSQVIEFVIFQSAQEHIDSIKKAIGR
jgi:hypothetical protein